MSESNLLSKSTASSSSSNSVTKSRTIFNAADKRWAYVKWIMKDKPDSYSIIQMSCVELKDEYQLNTQLKAKWNNSKYNAILLCIGKSDLIKF
jgi:hypothetical protein